MKKIKQINKQSCSATQLLDTYSHFGSLSKNDLWNEGKNATSLLEVTCEIICSLNIIFWVHDKPIFF